MAMHYSHHSRTPTLAHNITVTFLGTTSGGGPSETRNCSSLVLDALGDASLWMVDCAEGTLRQFAQQPFHDAARRLKLGKLTKIFITHMHADHVAGILTILRNVLGIPKLKSHNQGSPSSPPPSSTSNPPKIDIYGPRGLRRFLRLQLLLTHTHSECRYAVHELLAPGESASVPGHAGRMRNDSMRKDALLDVGAESESPPVSSHSDEQELLENEAPGLDIPCDVDGYWRSIVSENAGLGRVSPGKMVVDAGPIEHRDPCIGYIFREVPNHPYSPQQTPIPRKLVILGDTYDPSSLVPLIESPSPAFLPPRSSIIASSSEPTEDSTIAIDTEEASGVPPFTPVTLLVHEATDAYIPLSIDSQERTGRNRSAAIVDAKTRERGHSTPAMAGAFARRIGAERLVLNHIGSRFPAPSHSGRSPAEKFRLACIREIERQAKHAWAPPFPAQVQAAWDFMRVVIPPNLPVLPNSVPPSTDERDAYPDASRSDVRWDASRVPGDEEMADDMSYQHVPDFTSAATTATAQSRDVDGAPASSEEIQHPGQVHHAGRTSSQNGSKRSRAGASRRGYGEGTQRDYRGDDRREYHRSVEGSSGNGSRNESGRGRTRGSRGGYADGRGSSKRARP